MRSERGPLRVSHAWRMRSHSTQCATGKFAAKGATSCTAAAQLTGCRTWVSAAGRPQQVQPGGAVRQARTPRWGAQRPGQPAGAGQRHMSTVTPWRAERDASGRLPGLEDRAVAHNSALRVGLTELGLMSRLMNGHA